MKRRTLLNIPHLSDCCELNEVVVEQVVGWDPDGLETKGCRFTAHYRLVSWPSICKCGHPIHVAEPTQTELAEAYHLQEAEDV